MSSPRSFLIASWDGGGNTPGAINLGQRLLAAGHRVTLMGWTSMADRVRAVGVDFRTYPTTAPWPADRSIEEAFALLGSQAARRDILRATEEVAADVLVADCMMRAALEAADRSPERPLSWCTCSTSRSRTAGARGCSSATCSDTSTGPTWSWP